MTADRIEVLGVKHFPEVVPGDSLPELVLESLSRQGLELVDGDILVIAQKVVSKAEGRLRPLGAVEPRELAKRFADAHHKDPRLVELALAEARRIVRMDRGVLITETTHGFVCANSGIDASNVGPNRDDVALLPVDPDHSAGTLRTALEARTQKSIAVIVSDTFGRPWREGAVNVAIGISGMTVLADYRGQSDAYGRVLMTTSIAHADEVAAAAELVMGKLNRVPVAVVRGYAYESSNEGIQRLLRRADEDLFR